MVLFLEKRIKVGDSKAIDLVTGDKTVTSG